MANGGSHLSNNNNKRFGAVQDAASRRASVPQRPAENRSQSAERADQAAPARRADHSARPMPERRPAGQPPVPPPPKKRRRRKKQPLWPLLLLLLLIMLFAAFMLGKTLVSYFRNRASYDSLRDIAVVQLTPGPQTVVRETEDGTVEETLVSEIPLAIDWDTLEATNSDIIGWLYCPDTVISYPVVRAADNETYLTMNFEGEYNVGGSLFADYASAVGILASHLIIYGHNMKDNSMFGTLKNYVDEAYYDEHPVFYFLTPDQSYRVELLEAATISASLDNYPTYFGSDETAESYVGRISQNVYWFNENADYTSYQLMTMSTCTSGDDYRFILQGVMVPIQ